jgi:integrase
MVLPWAFPRDHADPKAMGRKRRIDSPVSYQTVYGHFDEIVTAAGLSKHTPHDTRHTVAVNLLDWTKDVRAVAAYLGDTVQTIVRHYLADGEVDWNRYTGLGDRMLIRGTGSAGFRRV